MNQTTEKITPSMEDYLEAILHISQEHRVARAKQIASRLNVAMSSVTGALRHLSEHGLVNYDPYEFITLTEAGERVAREVARRHRVLKSFLMNVLSVPDDIAEQNACRMEHAITQEVLERFLDFAEFVQVCPRAGPEWLKDFELYCRHGKRKDVCERCLLEQLEKLRRRLEEERAQMRKPVGLDTLQPGQTATVVKVTGAGETAKRIVDMGIVPGTIVKVQRIAPLGDPIEITVRGYQLSLRKAEASAISVQPE